jgi:hypothetical protein
MMVPSTPGELFSAAYRLSGEDGSEAETVIDGWIRSASVGRIVELAVAARLSFQRGVWREHVPLNQHIDPARLREAAPHATTTVAALLSTHRSGYVRELALGHLADSSEEIVVPFLLLRVDDIVPGLRATAESALLARLQPRFAPAFGRSHAAPLSSARAWTRTPS